MKKISKAALLGGAAAAVVAASVGVAAPAQAHYGAHRVMTVVTWIGGDSWLEVDYPGEGVVVESNGIKSVTDYWTAYPGARIGADPIMGDADFISCDLWVDGGLVVSDSAYAGDGTDANCVRVLR